MRKIVSHSLLNCKRYFTVYATILLVLLSSCAVKSNIKALTAIAAQTEHSSSKTNYNHTTPTFERCVEKEVTDQQMIQKFSFESHDLLPALLATAFFFLFLFPSAFRKTRHPLYKEGRKIRYSIPLFLEYQQIIVYCNK